jgi:LmbE family N-acetylglucosaminyl deacetylase
MTSSTTELPAWARVLVVIAHPDDESFGLGAVVDAFVRQGTAVAVVCFTKGEASTLHGVAGDLSEIRARELSAAAAALGVGESRLLDFPDGGLVSVDLQVLVGAAAGSLHEGDSVGLLVFDSSGVTGHLDHTRATQAAVALGEREGLGVLAWTLPEDVASTLREETGGGFSGHPAGDIDIVLTVDRARQLAAVREHASQAVPGSVLWRRLELLGDAEHLRWLRRP